MRTLSDQADVLLVVGSYNSSNSRRLAELGQTRNVPSYLIDGPDDIDLAWFTGDETVLITAGASAPESVVQECVDMLRWRFGGSVELQSVREEQIRFTLPTPLVGAARQAFQPDRKDRSGSGTMYPWPA